MRSKIGGLALCILLMTSFSACFSQPATITVTASSITPTSAVSRDQALAVASQFLPQEVLLQSIVQVSITYIAAGTFWEVDFGNFNTTRQVLIDFGRDTTSIKDVNSQIRWAYFYIDMQTGKVFQKVAGYVILGP